MLMLIDTPDPRYGPSPISPSGRRPWSRRHPTARVRLPFVARRASAWSAAYIVSSPLLIFGLSMVSMMLFFDAILALLPTGGDGLWGHRQ